MANYAQPPSVAPQKLPPSKPRSHTVENSSNAGVDSSGEGNSTRSESFGSGTSDTSQSSSGDNPARLAKRIPPPKPKPIGPTSSAGTPIRRFNFDTHEVRGSSPPPPPPPRRESSHALLIAKQSSMDSSTEEYALLANATSSQSTSLGM